MRDELTLKNYKIDEDKLLSLGFVKENDYFIYSKNIMEDQFLLKISIYNNIIISDVIEISSGEKFILYYTNASGEYVGKMRDEYNRIIGEVKKCCIRDVFKSKQAALVINYIKNKYNDNLEFLWDSSDGAIVRNKKNNKWYVVLLIIDKSKLGLNEVGKVEIIDLMLDSDLLINLIDDKKYFKAYHMNKKHWFTMKLDDSISTEEIYRYIDISYNISVRKK